MPACEICKVYAKRRTQLRPFSLTEMRQLEGYVQACEECKQRCTDWQRLATAHPATFSAAEAAQIRKNCAIANSAALLAMKDLGRLQAQGRQKQTAVRLFQARRGDPTALAAALPAVPTAKVGAGPARRPIRKKKARPKKTAPARPPVAPKRGRAR